MEEFLNSLYSSSSAPAVSALLLGLLTAISPCPLATNITAIGYIGKDIGNRNRVFYSGLIYTLGRAIAYTTLAVILVLGADQFKVSAFFQRYGEKILGPLLLLIGLFMLGLIRIQIPGVSKLSGRISSKSRYSYLDVFLLGLVFALAFCPYSGVLFFGMLIPVTISTSSLYLPVLFALATGLPVILFAWIIAYSVSGVGGLFNKIRAFELWFRRIAGVVFIATGIYYIIIMYL